MCDAGDGQVAPPHHFSGSDGFVFFDQVGVDIEGFSFEEFGVWVCQLAVSSGFL